MPNVLTESPPVETIADLLKRLGDIPPNRVPVRPSPGTAAEKDVIAALEAADKRLFELVDGTLVEKVMWDEESELALWLGSFLIQYVRKHKLGSVTGPDGITRLMPGLLRIPDLAFLSRARFPGGKRPRSPIRDLVPDLVVEVLSKGNTKKEMRRKLREYFHAGVRIVWYVDLKQRTVTVFTAVNRSVSLREGETLDGGSILPGFRIPLSQLFADRDA